MAAKPVVDGRRQRQKYYFDGTRSSTPKKNTLVWMVDRIQWREAVQNALRWLTVRFGEHQPTSMAEFFAIQMERFGGERQRQLQVLGDAIDKKMQNVWVAPLVRLVNTLEKFDALIPPIIRQHYEDIVGRGSGYLGYRRAVSNVEDAWWDWQVHVPCNTGGNNAGRLPIRCTGGFFADEFVEIGEPSLWIFDCRQGASGGDDVPWIVVEYGKVL
jgi:hypothetical protein